MRDVIWLLSASRALIRLCAVYAMFVGTEFGVVAASQSGQGDAVRSGQLGFCRVHFWGARSQYGIWSQAADRLCRERGVYVFVQ